MSLQVSSAALQAAQGGTSNLGISQTLGAATAKTVASPGGTASTSAQVMLGLAGTITPLVTGRVLVTICGAISSGTLNDGGNIQISYGTGAHPNNGDAVTGTQVGGNPVFKQAVASDNMCFSIEYLITSLTLGTAYWLDLAVEAVTGGTITLTQVSVVAIEI